MKGLNRISLKKINGRPLDVGCYRYALDKFMNCDDCHYSKLCQRLSDNFEQNVSTRIVESLIEKNNVFLATMRNDEY